MELFAHGAQEQSQDFDPFQPSQPRRFEPAANSEEEEEKSSDSAESISVDLAEPPKKKQRRITPPSSQQDSDGLPPSSQPDPMVMGPPPPMVCAHSERVYCSLCEPMNDHFWKPHQPQVTSYPPFRKIFDLTKSD